MFWINLYSCGKLELLTLDANDKIDVGWLLCFGLSEVEFASEFVDKGLLFHKFVLDIRS